MERTGNQEDPEPSHGGDGHPTLAEALTVLIAAHADDAALLRQLVRNTSRPNGHEGHNNQPRQCSYSDFLGTHPPTFDRAKEPLDADHWLRMIESKFGLLDCTDFQKPLFAAQQLKGPASAWWANYESSLTAGHRVSWVEFKNAFRNHHIPAGLIQRKF